MLTQEYLRYKFDYREDGWLIHKWCEDRTPQWNGRYANTIAGAVIGFESGGSYVAINILGAPRLGHRMIWLWHKGWLPPKIDHWDGDTINNRIENLREATQTQNNANANLGPRRGVQKHGVKYRARIKINGIQIELGSRNTFEEAKALYDAAAEQYFGEFAFRNRP